MSPIGAAALVALLVSPRAWGGPNVAGAPAPPAGSPFAAVTGELAPRDPGGAADPAIAAMRRQRDLLDAIRAGAPELATGAAAEWARALATCGEALRTGWALGDDHAGRQVSAALCEIVAGATIARASGQQPPCVPSGTTDTMSGTPSGWSAFPQAQQLALVGIELPWAITPRKTGVTAPGHLVANPACLVTLPAARHAPACTWSGSPALKKLLDYEATTAKMSGAYGTKYLPAAGLAADIGAPLCALQADLLAPARYVPSWEALKLRLTAALPTADAGAPRLSYGEGGDLQGWFAAVEADFRAEPLPVAERVLLLNPSASCDAALGPLNAIHTGLSCPTAGAATKWTLPSAPPGWTALGVVLAVVLALGGGSWIALTRLRADFRSARRLQEAALKRLSEQADARDEAQTQRHEALLSLLARLESAKTVVAPPAPLTDQLQQARSLVRTGDTVTAVRTALKAQPPLREWADLLDERVEGLRPPPSQAVAQLSELLGTFLGQLWDAAAAAPSAELDAVLLAAGGQALPTAQVVGMPLAGCAAECECTEGTGPRVAKVLRPGLAWRGQTRKAQVRCDDPAADERARAAEAAAVAARVQEQAAAAALQAEREAVAAAARTRAQAEARAAEEARQRAEQRRQAWTAASAALRVKMDEVAAAVTKITSVQRELARAGLDWLLADADLDGSAAKAGTWLAKAGGLVGECGPPPDGPPLSDVEALISEAAGLLTPDAQWRRVAAEKLASFDLTQAGTGAILDNETRLRPVLASIGAELIGTEVQGQEAHDVNNRVSRDVRNPALGAGSNARVGRLLRWGLAGPGGQVLRRASVEAGEV